MKLAGCLVFVVAAVVGVIAVVIPGLVDVPNAWIVPAATAGSLVLVGFLLLWLARKFPDHDELLKKGLPGSATIQQVRETGLSVTRGANQYAVLDFALIVHTDGQDAYSADVRSNVPRIAMGMVTPGTTVFVKVDPRNPVRVAIDWTAAGVGGPGGQPGPGPAPVAKVGSAADLLSWGVPGIGTVKGTFEVNVPPGTNLEKLGPGDRILGLELEVEREDGISPFRARVGHWVPASKAAAVIVGTRLRVAVHPDDPNSVAIDWGRSPV